VGVPSPLPPPRFIAPSLLAKAGCKAINKGTGTERKNNKNKKQTATTRQKKIKVPLLISTFSYFILSFQWKVAKSRPYIFQSILLDTLAKYFKP